VLIRDRVGGRRGGEEANTERREQSLDTSQMQAENVQVPHGATRLHVARCSCAVVAVHNAAIVTHAAAAAAAVQQRNILDRARDIQML